MNNKYETLLRLVSDIYAVQDDDIQCEMAATLIMQSSEGLLSDEVSRKQYPSLWRHFDVCADCAREYQILVSLNRLETNNQLRQPEQIPPIPGREYSLTWAKIKEAIIKTFPTFTSTPDLVPQRSEGRLGLEPITIELESKKVYIDLLVDGNATIPKNYDLICTIETLDDADGILLEGTPVQLQRGLDETLIQEQTLDELGELAFINLAPGSYTLRFTLNRQEYVVTQIELPDPLF